MIEASARGAWKELEAKLRPFVARRIRCEADTDDVLQDVFLRLQRGLPSLRDDERFGPWVYRVARSAIVDHHRSSARRAVPMAEPPEPERAASASDDDEQTEQHDVASYMALFVAMLPSPYREAITLTELQGLTQKEAADLLGISVSGMKSRVQRGRKKLRAALEGCCHFALDARNHVIGCERRPDAKLPEGCCSR